MSEKLYVLGHPVSHSKSPVMYNAVYEKAGLPWHYGLMDVPTAPEAEAFLAARDFLSINITTPYKPEAFAAADVRAASATLAHGANVLVNKDGALIAYNTDGQGCVAYLERAGVDFRGASVVVCGTGPTSLSILHAVAQAGPDEVILIGRDKAKARNVMRTYADELGAMVGRVVDMPAFKEGHLSFSEVYKQVGFKFGSYATSRQAIAGADIIIDATPLGMKAGDPAPFDTALLSAGPDGVRRGVRPRRDGAGAGGPGGGVHGSSTAPACSSARPWSRWASCATSRARRPSTSPRTSCSRLMAQAAGFELA